MPSLQARRDALLANQQGEKEQAMEGDAAPDVAPRTDLGQPIRSDEMPPAAVAKSLAAKFQQLDAGKHVPPPKAQPLPAKKIPVHTDALRFFPDFHFLLPSSDISS